MAVAARRERERTARREAILDAAEELVVSEGYHGLRMDAVADAVELSKGTLYLYFANKDALCAAVATRFIDTFIPFIESAVDEAPSGLDKIGALLHAQYRFTQENPQHFRFALGWLSAGQTIDDSSEAFQTYRARVGQVLSILVSALQQGQRDGSIRKDIDPLNQAVQIWTSFIGVVLVGVNRESMEQRIPAPVDLGRLVPLHVDSVLRALASEGAS
ncbi:MAG: TetR/AcrR family transcriptional regulator [Myxococcales bacterium]|nr:MAG: TetR/AcrR family transcriptional regulator [Myxococcales bacterium]